MKRGEGLADSDPERRGRTHDATEARRAILEAAEEVFAQHGFDGVRIDTIAAAAGHDESLILQYFGDKLNLYTEVFKRSERQEAELQAQVLGFLLEDETILTDARKFRTLLETATRILFDYLEKHPRLLRLLAWEQAAGWQTWTKIAGQMNTGGLVQSINALCSKAQSAGLLRPGVDPLLLILMAEQMYMSYLTSLPLFETVLPATQVSSPETRARVQKYITEFVVHGMLIDSTQARL